MTSITIPRKWLAAAAIVLVAAMAGNAAFAGEAADPVLLLQLSDTVVSAGSGEGWISVNFANYQDSLAGFCLRVVLDRPDVIEFITDEVDTSGTLVSGWDFVRTGVTSTGADIRIVALADILGPPNTPGLPPAESPGVLCRIRYRILDDIQYPENQVVNLLIADGLAETNFSDPRGILIGTITYYDVCDTMYLKCIMWEEDSCLGWIHTTPEEADSVTYDTLFRYWNCHEWSGDTCLLWIAAAGPPADSVAIDSVPRTVRDTVNTVYVDGRVEVSYESCCIVPGDVNGDNSPDIGDAVFLINFIFREGAPPSCPGQADTNGDCRIDVADAVRMICHIFRACPAPVCGPQTCDYGF